jgi:hypothetical protein
MTTEASTERSARPGSHEAITRDGMFFPIEPGDDKPANPSILDQSASPSGISKRTLKPSRLMTS